MIQSASTQQQKEDNAISESYRHPRVKSSPTSVVKAKAQANTTGMCCFLPRSIRVTSACTHSNILLAVDASIIRSKSLRSLFHYHYRLGSSCLWGFQSVLDTQRPRRPRNQQVAVPACAHDHTPSIYHQYVRPPAVLYHILSGYTNTATPTYVLIAMYTPSSSWCVFFLDFVLPPDRDDHGSCLAHPPDCHVRTDENTTGNGRGRWLPAGRFGDPAFWTEKTRRDLSAASVTCMAISRSRYDQACFGTQLPMPSDLPRLAVSNSTHWAKVC